MGLDEDVADILDDNPEEEKKEEPTDAVNGLGHTDGFYGGGLPPSKSVDIISSIMREN